MGKLKILIAEDDGWAQELYKKGLPDDVFEKHFAEDGKGALELYHSLKPDIIILDIMLPVITGYSILKEIREKFGDRSTAIIMVSSFHQKADRDDCFKIGIQGYIVKPFKYNEIGNRIIQFYQNMKA